MFFPAAITFDGSLYGVYKSVVAVATRLNGLEAFTEVAVHFHLMQE